MNKLPLFLLFLIFLVSTVSAFGGGIELSIDPVFTIKSHSCVDLIDVCENCTSINVTSLFLPNSTIIEINESMEQHTVEFNYTYCHVDLEGIYYYTACSNLDGEFDCVTYPFLVSSSGVTQNSFFENPIFIILLGLAICLLLIGISLELPVLGFFGGIFFTLGGMFTLIYGFNNINNLYTQALGIAVIGLGILFITASAFEWLKE